MAAGGTEGGAPTNGLSTYDIAQAEKMFNSNGEKIADSVNQADDDDNSAIEKIAQANAAKIAAANLDKANTEAKITANEILKETGGLQSTSGQTAGAGVGSGVGGSDYAGAMRKGGLTSKKK